MLETTYIIIYTDGTIWQSNMESHAISKLDSDDNILAAFSREKIQRGEKRFYKQISLK